MEDQTGLVTEKVTDGKSDFFFQFQMKTLKE